MNTKPRKKKKGKKIIWLILIIVIVIGVVIAVKSRGNQEEVIPTVQTVRAEKGELQEEISVSGTVAGAETISIFAPCTGTVKEVFERAGDELSAGTLLFTYDLDKLDKELYQAKLQNERTQISYENTLNDNSKGTGKVKEAKTNLAVLEQQIKDHENYLKNLQKELSDYQTKTNDDYVLQSYNLKKRQAQLQSELADLTPGTTAYNDKAKELEEVLNQMEKLSLQQSLSAKSDYLKDLEKKISDETQTIADLQEYKAKMESQKATGEATTLDNYSRRQLEIDMELTDLSYQNMLEEAELAKKGVSTEVQGVLTSISAVPGSSVASGMVIATLERTDTLKINASATKYALTRLKVGQKVEAQIGDNTYQAKVSHIDRIATAGAVNNSSAVAFEVELLEKDESIYLGMDAKMTIYTNKAENAWILPTQAVNANKDGDFVYVVVDGKIVKKPIKVGIISNGKAEITEGITDGDEVVYNYGGNLEDGKEVLTIPADID